ncbi:hypothetical protein Y032_0011g1539 [Ancylostoma ceylanicum]|uniref:Uncharacterized protein n=1 Tax=Ancylostoma ceylanicum TaxID=53326 RepID=A0A016VEN5_9BILA|nr:hypothetical protein Y032_0011g1539 [Ancylostoma ceylanicum]
MTSWAEIEDPVPFDEFFRNTLLPQSVPAYHIVEHTVECLFRIKGGEMERLLLLTMLLDQETCGMYGVSGAAPGYKTILVSGESHNITNSAVDDVLKNLHGVGEEANRSMIGTVRLAQSALRFHIGIVVLRCQS